jgi:hypothetical protein
MSQNREIITKQHPTTFRMNLYDDKLWEYFEAENFDDSFVIKTFEEKLNYLETICLLFVLKM